ncbi:glycerol dehydrogenase [Enterococcus sp. BWT-B8]|uniref:glycerol dehydrogenase n=1 Tax=unclassified Enterococcus TaxID=2608891 RepID=UPI001E350BB9|nr:MULTISPECIES: glycerol dehydrogenase [unclassified Enterococcus]MCB5953065.1 glycerol dehydrogenase [Enterococcus sp. BWT-B8]MCB5955425.1 glycerol dehydrogenase [Enterococcus sp. CWB-B31]
MEKLFVSPSKYVQGRDLLRRSGPYIQTFGNNALILTDEFVWTLVGESYDQQLTSEGLKVAHIIFNGESSEKEIQRIINEMTETSSEVLLALGGGKVIDAGKAIADQLNIPIVVIPTTASTDAPTSSVSVLYEDDGRFKTYALYQKNPDLVLVDTEIIVNAPVRTLIAGIADGLATGVEARSVWKNHGVNVLGQKPTFTALAIAERCEDVLFTYGLQAVEDNRKRRVTDAFEAVVEANILMSGLGFESGGLSAAHALHNGFSAIKGKVNLLMHGEKVAFTTLVQLVLEEQPTEMLTRYIDLFSELGLPINCRGMGLDFKDEKQLGLIAEQSLSDGDCLKQQPRVVTKREIVRAIQALDVFVENNYA